LYVNLFNDITNYHCRHLADACNELGQAFASRLEELKVIPCDLKSPFEGDCAVSRLGLSFDIFHQRAVKDSSMAESYYSSAISLFDCLSSSSDEIRNVIAAECNRSSLKRLLAIRSSEFIRDALGPLLPLTKESQNQSEEGIVRYHKLLSIISRAILGKKGIFYSFAMSSAASKKKKNGLLNNSSTLILEDESLLAYKYEPLNYIEEGISICERMQKKAESLGSNATISKNDPGMKMVINEMARHHFLKGILFALFSSLNNSLILHLSFIHRYNVQPVHQRYQCCGGCGCKRDVDRNGDN
jgi:hypothetical protein